MRLPEPDEFADRYDDEELLAEFPDRPVTSLRDIQYVYGKLYTLATVGGGEYAPYLTPDQATDLLDEGDSLIVVRVDLSGDEPCLDPDEPVPDFVTLGGALSALRDQETAVVVPHPGFANVSLDAADIDRYGHIVDAVEQVAAHPRDGHARSPRPDPVDGVTTGPQPTGVWPATRRPVEGRSPRRRPIHRFACE